MSGAAVSISVDSNAVATSSGSTTGSDGTITATITAGTDKSNRSVTVTAKSGALTKTATFLVTGTNVTASYTSTVAPGSKGNVIHYLVQDVNSNAITGTDIAVTGAGVTSQNGKTDASGRYDFTYDAPAAAGSLTITAVVSGVSYDSVIQVQGATAVPGALGPISSASISANPITIAANSAGSTANQTQIRALFVGAANAPIQNVRVRFDLNSDPNNIGGTLSVGNSLVYTAVNGTATAAYIPGTLSSPNNGVQVRACYDLVDFALGTCPNSVIVKLTVVSSPISVSIGKNALLEQDANKLVYTKKFVVSVVDSAGNPVSGATINPVLYLPRYYKGQWFNNTGTWIQSITAVCANEDTNRNGILDAGDDINGNGQLDPRTADAWVQMVTTQTDANGTALLQISHLHSSASWLDYELVVTAKGVSGTEGSAKLSGPLSYLAADVADPTIDTGFTRSPYGVVGDCKSPN